MTPEEMYAFEEKNGLPHFPPDPPPPVDPNNLTPAEAQIAADHMIACLDVAARGEAMLGDYDRAAVLKLAKDQITLLTRVLMANGEVEPSVWSTIQFLGENLSRRASKIAAEDDDD